MKCIFPPFSVTTNPDFCRLLNLISIDNVCVILLSAYSTLSRTKYLITVLHSGRGLLFQCSIYFLSISKYFTSDLRKGLEDFMLSSVTTVFKAAYDEMVVCSQQWCVLHVWQCQLINSAALCTIYTSTLKLD